MQKITVWSGVLFGLAMVWAQPSRADTTVSILMRDGATVEGAVQAAAIKATVDGKTRTFPLSSVLSVQLGDAPSAIETARIAAGITALQASDRTKQDAATEQLTDIGLPVLTPLLDTLQDSDAYGPKPLYRLFERIIPGVADMPDRSLDMIRLANGEILRGKLLPETTLTLKASDGTETQIARQTMRRFAVLRKEIKRNVTVHSLNHCIQLAWLNTGIALTPASQVNSTAQGFLRLAYKEDGWAMNPDGLQKPGPNYNTNLTGGFPFGALLVKSGVEGKATIAGQKMTRSDLGAGRLYFTINDNPHWQNNLGTYRLTLKATNAYDLGDAQ